VITPVCLSILPGARMRSASEVRAGSDRMSVSGQSEKRPHDPAMSAMALTPDAYADAGEA
jgi:hypothetical protein